MEKFSIVDDLYGVLEEHSTLESAEKALEEQIQEALEEHLENSIESEMIMEDREAEAHHRSSVSEDHQEMERRAIEKLRKERWIIEN